LKLLFIGSEKKQKRRKRRVLLALEMLRGGFNQRKISWEMMVICKRSEQGRWVEMSMGQR
jgi:hypothetical protein